MSIVALEINPKRILLAAGRKNAAGPLELSHLVEISLEGELSEEQIADVLKQAVQDHGLAKHDAVVVLSRSESELREIEFPPVPDDELPDMVTFKAKSDFASFSDRWLLDFVSLGDDESKPRRVLASAISPNVQERIERILSPSGLKLKQLVLRPFAIMDLLATQDLNGPSQLIVSPGEDFTDILVADGSKLVTTRTIRVPQSHTPEQRSRQLLSEVRRTLASSKRQLDGKSLERLLLFDNEKSNKELIGNLGQRLKLETQVIDPLDKITRSGQSADGVDQPWPFAPLIGSIVELGSDRADSIDFLNPTKRAEAPNDHRKWWTYAAVAAVAACLVMLMGWLTLRSQRSEIARITEELKDQVELNQGGSSRPSVDVTLARVKMLDDWQKGNIQWLDELDELSRRFLTADEAMVTRLEAQLKRKVPTVELAGKIVSNDEDRKLFDSLEQRPFVVTPTKADVVGDSDYPYSIGTRLVIERKGNAWLKAVDDRAREFKKNLSRQGSGAATATGETATGRAN